MSLLCPPQTALKLLFYNNLISGGGGIVVLLIPDVLPCPPVACLPAKGRHMPSAFSNLNFFILSFVAPPRPAAPMVPRLPWLSPAALLKRRSQTPHSHFRTSRDPPQKHHKYMFACLLYPTQTRRRALLVDEPVALRREIEMRTVVAVTHSVSKPNVPILKNQFIFQYDKRDSCTNRLIRLLLL